MRLCRLAVLLAVFAGTSMPAAAQYTTKETASGYTSRTADTTASAPARQASAPAQAGGTTSGFTSKAAGATASAPAKQAPATAQARGAASGFTSRSAGTTAPVRTQAKTATGQPVFRPRPKEETPQDNTAEDDELPSFEALEGNAGTPQENLPPPPPPKGEIWVYVSGFEYRDLTGKTMNCSWKIVVQNRTDTPIEKLNLAYYLLDLNFALQVNPVAPNSFSETLHGVYSEKCPAMAHIKPKISVEKCKIGPLVDQECFKYITIK